MNISLQNVDKVSALLTLKLEKADYQARVEKTLRLIVRKLIFRDSVRVWCL